MQKYITFFLLLLLTMPFITFAQDDPVASLEPYTDLVEILPAGETEWQPVTDTILVVEGDQIRTDAGGWALLTYFEGVSTEILPDTDLTITTLALPTAESDSFSVEISMFAGDTFNVVDAVLDQNSSFEVRTPNATAAVRGTRFYVHYSADDELSRIGVREGSVMLIQPTMEETAASEPFFVEAGFQVEVGGNGNLSESNDEWIEPERPTIPEITPPSTDEAPSLDGLLPAGDPPPAGNGVIGSGGLLLGEIAPSGEGASAESAVLFVQRDLPPTPAPNFTGVIATTVPAGGGVVVPLVFSASVTGCVPNAGGFTVTVSLSNVPAGTNALSLDTGIHGSSGIIGFANPVTFSLPPNIAPWTDVGTVKAGDAFGAILATTAVTINC